MEATLATVPTYLGSGADTGEAGAPPVSDASMAPSPAMTARRLDGSWWRWIQRSTGRRHEEAFNSQVSSDCASPDARNPVWIKRCAPCVAASPSKSTLLPSSMQMASPLLDPRLPDSPPTSSKFIPQSLPIAQGLPNFGKGPSCWILDPSNSQDVGGW